MGGKMSARDLVRLLTNAGVSAEEMRWSGLESYLETHPVVIKSDLISYLQRKLHNIVIHQVDYEAEQEDFAEELNGSSHEGYGEYTLPGGENYREFLISIGANPDDSEFIDYVYERYKHRYDKETLRNQIVSDPYKWQYAWRQYLTSKGEYFPEFESGHYQFHTSPIAHIRATERKTKDGKRALHLEEVQSDWHQQGRKRGYYEPDELVAYSQKLNDLKAQIKVIEAQGAEYLQERGINVTNADVGQALIIHKIEPYFSQISALRQEMHRATRDMNEASRELAKSGKVPQGPFAKNWHELAMKHALDIAAREGYDRVTWNTGKINRGIFSLSKHVDKVEIVRNASDLLDIRGWKDEELLIQKNGVEPRELDNYVGKEVAEKYLNSGRDEMVLEGPGLEVGGHGMSGFYDKILPEFMRKYTKRWNAEVQPIEVDTSKYNHYITERKWKDSPPTWWVNAYGKPGTQSFDSREEAERFREENKTESWAEVHGVDITPEMREEIRSKGQRLATIARSLSRTGQGRGPE
jgi:hypothetical protein